MLKEVLQGRKEANRPSDLESWGASFQHGRERPIDAHPVERRGQGGGGQRGIDSSILAMMVGSRMRMEAGRGEAVASCRHLMAPNLVCSKRCQKMRQKLSLAKSLHAKVTRSILDFM